MSRATITLRIPSEPGNVFLVGVAVQRICAEVFDDPNTLLEAELGVVEAVNNVIEHAYNSESGHAVDVVIKLEEGRLVFEVADHGPSVDWETVVSNRDRQRGMEDGGRGISIIHACMDKVSYRRCDDTNVLTLVKEFVPSAKVSATN